MLALRDFLVRVALDDAFREVVRTAPDDAFAGYDLDEAQKAALRRPDAGWMSLLGGVVREAAPAVHEPAPEPAPGPSLPEMRLLVTLSPYTMPDLYGPAIFWSASLHPWPSDAEPQALRFVVRVTPRGAAVGGALSGLAGSYTATIQAAPIPTPLAVAPASPAVAADPTVPADPAVAAKAVLAASPADRYARLRDLLDVVEGAS